MFPTSLWAIYHHKTHPLVYCVFLLPIILKLAKNHHSTRFTIYSYHQLKGQLSNSPKRVIVMKIQVGSECAFTIIIDHTTIVYRYDRLQWSFRFFVSAALSDHKTLGTHDPLRYHYDINMSRHSGVSNVEAWERLGAWRSEPQNLPRCHDDSGSHSGAAWAS